MLNLQVQKFKALCRVYWAIEEKVIYHSLLDSVKNLGILPVEEHSSRIGRAYKVVSDVKDHLGMGKNIYEYDLEMDVARELVYKITPHELVCDKLNLPNNVCTRQNTSLCFIGFLEERKFNIF